MEMKTFNYSTAINALKLDSKQRLNDINEVPVWCDTESFRNYFLPFVKIVGDSREQDKWVQTYCDYYGIAFEWAVGKASLKEGDYTFQVVFGNKTFDYNGLVAFERKGSVSEFYNNCTNDRQRLRREFDRLVDKDYKKRVLMLQFGESITDLLKQEYYANGKVRKVGKTLYSTVMSWKQPNCASIEVIQSEKKKKLFWLMLQECYYFFRNEIKAICLKEKLMGG